ncbi:YheC/YheD family protein [Paenibacillus xerothermodurans]|uniref:YheC/YheD family endospore coat-associated protein n=1 Tax=Paenibacillus xerothermodurans TaxID=1977292 RepID=UPI001FB2E3BC|nr:YheC/YheD family protein [Paenibacillus xerothermodurans]
MLKASPRHSLGILTAHIEGQPPFLNRDFYRRLCVTGSKAGITVFVFTARSIDWAGGSVNGYAFDEERDRWIERRSALPRSVYDRCFCSNRAQYNEYRDTIRKLREHGRVLFLGHGLSCKYEVQRLLERDGRFAGHLPHTEPMHSVRTVAGWLRQRGEVLLKPRAGSHGRGVLLVQHRVRAAGGADAPEGTVNAGPAFTVRGRDARNRRVERGFADAPALLRWLHRFTAQRRYLLQQYLLLQTFAGDAYDVRSLVQKDGTGRWQVTGMAVRRGQDGSLTANLHGGGRVEPADEFLAAQFGASASNMIMTKLHELSMQIPEALERRHGRLVELGIDFGIDTQGRIWILEVNSKPGRSILTRLNDNKARMNGVLNPIRYARFLIRQSPEGILK